MIILLPLGQERMVDAPGSPETTESMRYSQLYLRWAPLGPALRQCPSLVQRCPSYGESNKGTKERLKELGIRLIEVLDITRPNCMVLRWLNTVLQAVSGNLRDGACFKLDKQTWRRKQ